MNVYVANHTSPNSTLITWDSIPAASRNGVILGYKVLYTAVLVSGQTHIITDTSVVTVQAPSQRVLLRGLNSFTVYKVEVLGFNEVGDGPLSSPVFSGLLNCLRKQILVKNASD